MIPPNSKPSVESISEALSTSTAFPAPGLAMISPEDAPTMEDTSKVGGWVWIFLFGCVIFLSLVSNLALCTAVFTDRRKHKIVYFMLILFFVINLIDYSVLLFEFSLGMEHLFPYSEGICTLYQVTLRSYPILQAWAIVILLHYTCNVYLLPEDLPFRTAVGAASQRTSNHHHHTLVQCNSRTSNLYLFGSILLGLFLATCLFSIPTAYFAKVVVFEENLRYCEIDPSALASPQGNVHKAVSFYYLIYQALLSYWLPLLVSIPFMLRLAYSKHGNKYPEVALVSSTAISFFVFYLLHGCVVLIRHSLDVSGHDLSTYHAWMIKVLQSLFWLLAFSWHVFRAALVILLDPDLKESVLHPSCCFARRSPPASSASTIGIFPSSFHTSPSPLALFREGRRDQHNQDLENRLLMKVSTMPLFRAPLPAVQKKEEQIHLFHGEADDSTL
ncbi:hypothetical protein TCAL_13934 [Tigriopus californicus]|uniref:G-protein coupled receptors family 1 profile domain-containing protein n=1 Tax=Tigriopus californicus TaxID=6832 RepID=A0A553PI92_TIGCA|nr:uncharacterized protein LOC131880561 [Tigriopus californicus]TRY77399.1 hypothetical protein TCAL_13934 [Tigriopus californicus]|eukprot:TCALIF_13934-PA protein Name:"Protein of unknown function" AED:0.00 eAED:0.00 QI:314/1/1/1/1/1/3/865/443